VSAVSVVKIARGTSIRQCSIAWSTLYGPSYFVFVVGSGRSRRWYYVRVCRRMYEEGVVRNAVPTTSRSTQETPTPYRPTMHITRSLSLLSLVGITLASSGDRSPEFRDCVTQCQSSRCQSSAPMALPLDLQLTRWTCTDDCKYSCVHETTDRDVKRGVAVQQYHGKWPFWRLAGIQEPASVAFSLLNLWAHARGALKVRKRVPDNHPMKSYYLVWALASINAWIWSSVFHTRGKSIS